MSACMNTQLNNTPAKRYKRNLRLTALAMAVLTMVFLLSGVSATASAAGFFNIEQECSLTLNYHHEETKLQSCGVKLYRVAAVAADGAYTLTGAFEAYSVKINDVSTATQWMEAASTLAAYAAADQIAPEQAGKTDADGGVRFSALQTGLYLVVSEDVVTDECTYIIAPFLIAVPNLENSSWVFDVSANPKSEVHYPTPDVLEYQVIKLWEDAGFEQDRPDKILIDILKDGEKVSQQVLSQDNNWAYFWTAPDDGSVWQAVEREVPRNYTVRILKNGTTITVVNTSTKEPPVPTKPEPPHTGDHTAPELLLLLMLTSGAFLAVLVNKRMKAHGE